MKQLTREQSALYRKAHRHLLLGISVALLYCAGIVILGEFVPIERFGPLIGVGVFLVTGIVILVMLRYRCPACGQVPRARVWSLGGGEVAYSSMVALFPKKCSSCGVRFAARDAVPGAGRAEVKS
jgi:hypothetical protein